MRVRGFATNDPPARDEFNVPIVDGGALDPRGPVVPVLAADSPSGGQTSVRFDARSCTNLSERACKRARGRCLRATGRPRARSCRVVAMDQPGPPDAGREVPQGRLSRVAAQSLLARGDELLAAGDFGDAAAHYQRVVGFDDPAVTAAALLGLGEARYRLDDEAGAVATWEAVIQLGDTSSTYPAWRNVAAARVRAGDLRGAQRAYREADRLAPPADKAEIASPPRLAGQGERRLGLGPSLLRQGPRRRSAGPGLDDHPRRHDHRLARRPVHRGRAGPAAGALARQGGGRRWGVLAALDGHARPCRPAPPVLQHVRPVPGRAHRRTLVRVALVPGDVPRLRRRRLGGELRVRRRRAGGRGVWRDLRVVRRAVRGEPDPPSGRPGDARDREPARIPRPAQPRLRVRVGRPDRQRGAPGRPVRRTVAGRRHPARRRAHDVRDVAAGARRGDGRRISVRPPSPKPRTRPRFVPAVAVGAVVVVVVAGLFVGTAARSDEVGGGTPIATGDWTGIARRRPSDSTAASVRDAPRSLAAATARRRRDAGRDPRRRGRRPGGGRAGAHHGRRLVARARRPGRVVARDGGPDRARGQGRAARPVHIGHRGRRSRSSRCATRSAGSSTPVVR